MIIITSQLMYSKLGDQIIYLSLQIDMEHENQDMPEIIVQESSTS
jgi:hypothetical protein